MEIPRLSIIQCKSCGKPYDSEFLQDFHQMKEKHKGLLINANSDKEVAEIEKINEKEKEKILSDNLNRYCCKLCLITVISSYQIHIPPACKNTED